MGNGKSTIAFRLRVLLHYLQPECLSELYNHTLYTHSSLDALRKYERVSLVQEEAIMKILTAASENFDKAVLQDSSRKLINHLHLFYIQRLHCQHVFSAVIISFATISITIPAVSVLPTIPTVLSIISPVVCS